jgi:subfamily B ATP-binding cassette protein MsbA
MSRQFSIKRYLFPYRFWILSSALLAIPLAALRASPVPLIKYLVDDLLVNRDQTKLLLFPLLFLALYLVNFVVRFLHYYLLRKVIARVNQRVKDELFDHLMGLSADYYTAQSSGALVSRAGQDPNLIDQGLATINIVVREPLTFLALFGYSLYLNWKLTLLTFLIFPPLVVIFMATSRNLKRYIASMQEQNARLFSILQESFSGFRVIKLFGLEQYSRKKFFEQSERYTNFHLKMAKIEELSHPAVELVTSFAIALVIYYGGSQVIAGTMSSGDLLAFFAAFAMMMNPLRTLNDVNLRLSQLRTAGARIGEIFSWTSRIVEKPGAVAISRFERELRLEDVRFSYPDAPEREILKGINFSLKPGSRVAIVGESGAGKSSLIQLLPRIFDVTGGRIILDGRDIRDLEPHSLRALFAVVSQDIFLFNDTVLENIRCGRHDSSPDQVIEAARRAHALDFIERLPQKWETLIGERGQKLSGGERQRLSIARAFLRESPILILDEATSNLDTGSERAVQEVLDSLMVNRTTLVIAHRLSTIRNADLILVLKQGVIVEAGTHDELMASKTSGEYIRFHQMAESSGRA